MEGKRRLEDVLPATQDEAINRLRGPQRPHAQFVVLKHLSVAQGDRCASRTLDPYPQPPDKVLAEVDQSLAGWRSPDLPRLEFVLSAHRGADVRSELSLIEVEDVHTGPARSFETRTQPSIRPPACINGLTVIDVIG